MLDILDYKMLSFCNKLNSFDVTLILLLFGAK